MVMYILSDVHTLLSIRFSPLVFKDVCSGRLIASSLIWSEVKCTGWYAIIGTLCMGCYCQLFYCRVVGQWDVFGQYLKCYSVRPVRGREEGLARPWVEASDRSMRQMVATIPEM